MRFALRNDHLQYTALAQSSSSQNDKQEDLQAPMPTACNFLFWISRILLYSAQFGKTSLLMDEYNYKRNDTLI